jgi:hypothetical protein
MPDADHRREALVPQGFRLVKGYWWIYNASDKSGCTGQKLAAPASDDDHRRAGLQDRKGGGYGA